MRIGELVREKKLEGISDLRDESDKTRHARRDRAEARRGPEIVLNNLYKLTQLQDSFGMNMVALVDGQPRLLNLKQFLEFFLRTGARSSRGARCSSCARRASAATSSKASPSRCRTSTRSSR